MDVSIFVIPKEPKRAESAEGFMFEVGRSYLTQDGHKVRVEGRTDLYGYECLECSDGVYRYDRITSQSDAGRATGSNFDYSCPKNLIRPDSPIKKKLFANARYFFAVRKIHTLGTRSEVRES